MQQWTAPTLLWCSPLKDLTLFSFSPEWFFFVLLPPIIFEAEWWFEFNNNSCDEIITHAVILLEFTYQYHLDRITHHRRSHFPSSSSSDLSLLVAWNPDPNRLWSPISIGWLKRNAQDVAHPILPVLISAVHVCTKRSHRASSVHIRDVVSYAGDAMVWAGWFPFATIPNKV